MSDPIDPTPPSPRIGIFRRAAVERYSGAVESDTPDMLTPHRPAVILAGIALLGFAIALFWAG